MPTEATLLTRLRDLERRLAQLEANVTAGDGAGSGLDADTVDGIHASTTATANQLLALNASAKLPASITGDADTLDGYHAADLSRGIVCGYAFSGTDLEIDDAAGTWHTDDYSQVSFTLAATSTVYVAASVFWQQDTGTARCKFRFTNDAGAYSDATEALDDPSGYLQCTVIIGAFTSQAAGAHWVKLQGARVSTSANLYIKTRYMFILALED